MPDPRPERFLGKASDFKRSQCASCVHKHPGRDRCEAFPEGIPQEILLNRFDHSEVHPDQDNQITYEER